MVARVGLREVVRNRELAFAERFWAPAARARCGYVDSLVESTIRDAMFRDYRCVLLEDCAAEPSGHGLSRSNHGASLLAIQLLCGWISSSADLIRALKRSDD